MLFRNLTAIVLAAAAARAGADANVISGVEVKDEGAAVAIEIRGTKPPNFTTFSMADPPRFVIDLSESTFDGVAEDLVVDDGLVNVVKNLSYGSGATAIARVLVAFAREVDPPEVSAVGNTLLVRVAKPAGMPVAKADAKPSDDAKATADAEAKARADADAKAKADAEAKAQAEADAKAQAESQARADAERRAQEEQAQAAAAKDAEAKRQAEADAQARADAAAKADAEAQARAKAEADARAEADRRAAEATAAAPAQPAAAPAADALAALEAAPEAAPAEPEPVAPAPAVEPAPVADAAPAFDSTPAGPAPKAVLREVGFKQLATGSRVYVRTSATPRFTIQDVGNDVIRVELENTRVTRRNDVRFLDTSFFPSAVARVTPGRKGTSYVLDIKLRARVPYQQKIEGDLLALDFEAPAAPAVVPASAVAPDANAAAPAPAAE